MITKYIFCIQIDIKIKTLVEIFQVNPSSKPPLFKKSHNQGFFFSTVTKWCQNNPHAILYRPHFLQQCEQFDRISINTIEMNTNRSGEKPLSASLTLVKFTDMIHFHRHADWKKTKAKSKITPPKNWRKNENLPKKPHFPWPIPSMAEIKFLSDFKN